MWIPHFGYILWAEKDGVACSQSDKDKSEREFVVSFFLEDTDKRSLRDSDVNLEQDEQKILTVYPDNKQENLSILFQPNKDKRLDVIRVKIKATNSTAALRKAYNPLSQFLSFWCLAESSSTSFWALGVDDEKYKAQWVARPQTAQPFKFSLPKGLAFEKKFRSVLSLYREGRTSRSPFYRFFCFTKILESFYAKGEMFKDTNKIIIEHKEDPAKLRSKRVIDKELLIYALAHEKYPELEGLKYTKFWEWIRDKHRHLVAHAFPDKYDSSEWLNLDDFDLYTEFAIIGNIVDLVIRNLIIGEMELWQSFIDKGWIVGPESPTDQSLST